MKQIVRTDEFDKWLRGLRDAQAKARIFTRIDRLRDGNPGQFRSLGAALFELKIDYGPGYRIYYTHRGMAIVILLCGGDKSTQAKDIRRATQIATQIEVVPDEE